MINLANCNVNGGPEEARKAAVLISGVKKSEQEVQAAVQGSKRPAWLEQSELEKGATGPRWL